MSASKKENLFKKPLPSDFDGKSYLELNEDLRNAKLDPAEHYVYYGWREGRIYKNPFLIQLKQNIPEADSKKTVLIHIGLGRCGTSSLQFAFHSCRENFRLAKILYPKTLNGQTAHHELAPHIPDEIPSACERWNAISEEFEAGDYEMLLLSSEMFCECTDALLNHIYVLFKKYEVKIFFFGRAQQKLLPSIYSHWSSVGIGFRNFKSFYNLTKNQWNFKRILKRWSEKFGIHNICCNIIQGGDNSLDSFARMFSENTRYQLSYNNVDYRCNESLPRIELYVLKIFDRLLHPFSFHSTIPDWERIELDVRDRNTWLRSRLLMMMQQTSKAFPRRTRSLLTKAEKEEICSFYYESNREFHRIYLKNQPRQWFENP